jgi:flagellar protein FliS
MEEHNVAEKGEAISRALAIIDEGLRASLDKKAGGEIAENLDALYAYMISRLIAANLHNQTEPLDEVVRLLSDIKGAWEEIAPRPETSAPAEEPQRREPQSYGKV